MRADLADVAHASLLFAPYYAEALRLDCTAPSTMMRAAPSHGARAVSQLLRGETFAVLDLAGDWAWGYSAHDHYVGYVPAVALGRQVAATHIVTAPLAPVFAGPDIKAPVVSRLTIGARIAALADGHFFAIADGYVHRRHVRELAAGPHLDPVTTAERLLAQPYLWGGRGAGGVDCSGLVQIAFGLSGIELPRDSDQQATTGAGIGDDEPLKRADIVCFPGHVGIMASADTLVHANAHWMAVTAEPLADVIARLAPIHDRPVLARRRLLP